MLLKKNRKFIILLFFVSYIAIFNYSGLICDVKAQDDENNHVFVAVLSQDPFSDYINALKLDPRIRITIYDNSNITSFQDSVSDYNTTFICDFNLLNDMIIENIISNVTNGMGLFFQTNINSETYDTANLNKFSILLPIVIDTEIDGTPKQVTPDEFGNIKVVVNGSLSSDNIFLNRIGFTSMPQLLYLSKSTANSTSTVLLHAKSGEPIIIYGEFGSGKVLAFCGPIKSDTNEHIADWPYFNYLMYFSAMYLSNIDENQIDTYSEWPFSPLPSQNLKIIILIIIVLIICITFGLYFFMKKRSRQVPLMIRPPTELEQMAIDKALKGDKKEDTKKIDTKKISKKKLDEIGWSEIGYHKSLAGFSVTFYLSLALLLPLIVVIMYILPNFILTDPSQLGISFITGNIFSAVFIAGDFGLAQAFDKFVGENYIRDPAKALKYVQFFIWFQMISGLVQTGGIAIIGMYLIPKSAAIAFMSYQFVAKAFIQWPGTGYLFTHSMKALQRTDKEQLISLVSIILFDVAGTAVITGYFLALGRSNPLIGIVIGGSLGITFSEVFKTFGLLIYSGIVFARMDKRFSIWDMFRVDFDSHLVKETLIFGFKAMTSNVILLMGNFFVTIYIMLNLQSYTTYSAYIGSATLLLYPITFMVVLYENALPTTAESFGNKCVHLTEAYISFGWKYFATFGFLVFSSYLFFLNPFLTNILPPLYKPMGFFMGFYSITKLIMILGDFSRLFLVAVNRVGIYIWFISIEQLIRVIFIVSLLNNIARPEYLLIFGELPGAIIKSILIWIYTNKKVIKVRINKWQTIIAPFIAVCGYVLLGSIFMRLYLYFIETMDVLVLTIIFAFIIFTGLTMTIYPFILALAGGWDAETLRQLEFSARHSGPSKIFAMIFLKFTELGNKISPLYNKHPINYEDALIDVNTLTNLKIQERKNSTG